MNFYDKNTCWGKGLPEQNKFFQNTSLAPFAVLLSFGLFLTIRMHYSIVVHVCPMNFFYVVIVPRPILRHLILAWSRPLNLSISGDIWFLSDFGHYTYN